MKTILLRIFNMLTGAVAVFVLYFVISAVTSGINTPP